MILYIVPRGYKKHKSHVYIRVHASKNQFNQETMISIICNSHSLSYSTGI